MRKQMTLADLIQRLQELREQSGDVLVVVNDGMCQTALQPEAITSEHDCGLAFVQIDLTGCVEATRPDGTVLV